jgi:hypothetical protein
MLKFEFKSDSPKPGSGGTGTLFVDGKQIATGHVPKTQPFSFSADEGADVGIDNETAVSSDYEPASSEFAGEIESVTIAVSPAKLTAAEQKDIDVAGEAADKADD